MLGPENPFIHTFGGVDEGGSSVHEPTLNHPNTIDEFHTSLAAAAYHIGKMSLDTDLTQSPTYPYVGEISDGYGNSPSNF